MITITWLPSIATPAIASYDLRRAPNSGGQPGEYTMLANIPHDPAGANYNPTTNRFFYDDSNGDVTNWYSLRCIDVEGNASDWGSGFQPTTNVMPPPFPNRVSLFEDYPTAAAMQYQSPHGEPIDGAQVRVYRKTDYDLENFTVALGITMTNAAGNWINPVQVDAGFTYTVQFFKPGVFGPDTKEVVVP